MTPHYWQLFASQPTDLLLLIPFNRVLARIQEECTHWSTILNPIKTKALVVSRSRTANPPHGDLVLSGVYIRASPNLDILGVKFDRKLTFEDHEHGIVSPVSQNWHFKVGESYFCGHLCGVQKLELLMGLREQSTLGSFPEFYFLQFSVTQVLEGL